VQERAIVRAERSENAGIFAGFAEDAASGGSGGAWPRLHHFVANELATELIAAATVALASDDAESRGPAQRASLKADLSLLLRIDRVRRDKSNAEQGDVQHFDARQASEANVGAELRASDERLSQSLATFNGWCDGHRRSGRWRDRGWRLRG
jgi:hypothetical protein